MSHSAVNLTVSRVAALLALCEWEPVAFSFALRMGATGEPDFIVADHGTIWTFYPRSLAAQEWWKENVEPNAQTYGRNFVVEHRFVQDILDGLRRDGFATLNGGGEDA